MTSKVENETKQRDWARIALIVAAATIVCLVAAIIGISSSGNLRGGESITQDLPTPTTPVNATTGEDRDTTDSADSIDDGLPPINIPDGLKTMPNLGFFAVWLRSHVWQSSTHFSFWRVDVRPWLPPPGFCFRIFEITDNPGQPLPRSRWHVLPVLCRHLLFVVYVLPHRIGKAIQRPTQLQGKNQCLVERILSCKVLGFYRLSACGTRD
mmetsp:Transcript_62875/g.94913  ORF Transcript_62875/g.94913 Transcript_62875/m.94913 type:complete len:210 (-) Transcript_62875:81-710(-)